MPSLREGNWEFFRVIDGEVQYNDPQTVVNFTNSYENNEIYEDHEITIDVPVTKIVEQTGNVAPGKQTFTFEVYDFGVSSAGEHVSVTANTVETNGKGRFSGTIQLTLLESDYYRNNLLDEGFYVREKKGTAADWTYSDEIWYAMPNDNDGWAFYRVIDGEPQYNDPQDVMSFTNSYENNEIYEDHEITVEVPFTKNVEQTGNVAPGKQTFEFEVYHFGNSQAEGKVALTANTIETNGKGSFAGTIELTLKESELYRDGFLSEGFFVREKQGTAAGWTYSDEIWYAMPNDNDGWAFYRVIDGEPQYNDPQGTMSFTNQYKENSEVTPTKPAEPTKPATPTTPSESPKTGDNSNLALWISLLLASAIGVIGTVVYGQKRKYVQ